MTMKALDPYACSGSASRGLMAAGLHVTGVDIVFQPRPITGDPFILGRGRRSSPRSCGPSTSFGQVPLPGAVGDEVLHNARPHLDLIPQTRALLERSGKPYVIENVEGARRI